MIFAVFRDFLNAGPGTVDADLAHVDLRLGQVLLVAGGLGLLGACSEGSSSAPPPAQLDVTLQLIDNNLALSSFREAGVAGAGARTAGQATSKLIWQFVGENGTILANGELQDPREARAEFDADGSLDPVQFVTRQGRFLVTLPRHDGLLRVYNEELEEIAAASLELESDESTVATTFALKTNGKEALLMGDPVLVQGSKEGAVRIVMASEGFTENELPKFEATVAYISGAIPWFGKHSKQIAVYRQNVRSAESGIDHRYGDIGQSPPAGFGEDDWLDVDSAFSYGAGAVESEAGLFPAPRGTESERMAGEALEQMIRERADAQVLVLVLNDQFGSKERGRSYAKGYESSLVVFNVNDSPSVLIHELGHAVFGLADEYVDPGVACERSAQPNISMSIEDLPWKSFVNTTQLPTPEWVVGVVGAYAGAGYCEAGFRPQLHCMMRDLHGFCDVCQATIDKYLEALPPLPSSCTNRCGKYVEEFSCQCDDGCGLRGDCCEDYPVFCTLPSCDGYCGITSTGCSCQEFCPIWGNCCPGYYEACEAVPGDYLPNEDTSGGVEGSCVDQPCGLYDESRSCQCDSNCAAYGDCCDDYSELCSCFDRCYDASDFSYSEAANCQCDQECAFREDCCSDLQTMCGA